VETRGVGLECDVRGPSAEAADTLASHAKPGALLKAPPAPSNRRGRVTAAGERALRLPSSATTSAGAGVAVPSASVASATVVETRGVEPLTC